MKLFLSNLALYIIYLIDIGTTLLDFLSFFSFANHLLSIHIFSGLRTNSQIFLTRLGTATKSKTKSTLTCKCICTEMFFFPLHFCAGL